MRRALVAVFVTAFAVQTALLATIAVMPSAVIVPACQEDEVLVGQGDFRAGYWDAYHCVNFEEV
jgi:hypothetical protein